MFLKYICVNINNINNIYISQEIVKDHTFFLDFLDFLNSFGLKWIIRKVWTIRNLLNHSLLRCFTRPFM